MFDLLGEVNREQDSDYSEAAGLLFHDTTASPTTTRHRVAWSRQAGSFSAFEGYTFDGPVDNIYTSSFISTGRRTGQGILATTNSALTAAPTSKLTTQFDVTYYKSGWIGSHELQAGVFAQPRLSNENQVEYANGGNPGIVDLALVDPSNPAGAKVAFRQRVYDSPTITSSSRLAQDYAFYLQDSWKPTARLTLNAGIRIDKIIVEDRLFDQEVQNSWEVGPRFGATYVLTSDNKNVVRANWGRVADLPQPGYLPSAGGNPVGFVDLYDNNLDGVFETSFRTPPVTPENSDQVVDPDRHMPFIDEWILGYRRQLPGQMSVDISYVHRDYRDRPALVEINRIIENNVFRGYRNEAQNDIFFVTNNIWNTQVYDGLEFTVAKRTRALNLIAGYTRGWQELEGTWLPGDPGSIIQPDAFPNNRGIGTIRGNEMSSTSPGGSLQGNADTRSPSWQKHAFRAGVAYTAPWNFLLASNLAVLSGPYSGPVVDRIAAADPQFGPSTVTLSNGRVVSNPLATTIRFAFPTRGEGQIKAPNLVLWNIRVGRDFVFGTRRLTVAFDVINVTNRDADQQFQTGGNQLYNTTNYAIAPDGSFRGQTRQAPRSGQLSFRFIF